MIMQQNMICPVCGNTTSQGQSFCGSCGTKLTLTPAAQQDSICPTCASPVKQGQQFCGICGATLNADSQQQWSPAPHPAAQMQSSPQPQMQTQTTDASQGALKQPVEAAAVPPPLFQSRETASQDKHIQKRNHVVLPAVVTALRVIAWITIIGGFIVSVIFAFSDVGNDVFSSFIAGVAADVIGMTVKFGLGFVLSLVYGCGLLALAEICTLLTIIKNNTTTSDYDRQ